MTPERTRALMVWVAGGTGVVGWGRDEMEWYVTLSVLCMTDSKHKTNADGPIGAVRSEKLCVIYA